MGLADRDYYRKDIDSLQRGSRVGVLGFLSINTWLIVVNVAIFFVAVGMSSTPALRAPLFYQPRFEATTTPAQMVRARYLPQAIRPNLPVQTIELYDPETVVQTPQGQAFVVIGQQQVAMVSWLDFAGHFSTDRVIWRWEIWRFLTFQFLHASPMHLLLNMMGLYFFGGLVEQYLGSYRYAAFYLTCGIFGAVSYLALNLLGAYIFPHTRIPGLLFEDPATPLVGASAGIFGVLMAAAFIAPKSIVHVFGIIPLKTRTAVYLFTGISVYNLVFGSANAGGEAAHVGGAIAGYFFIRRTHLLRDFFDILGQGGRY